MDNQHCRFCGQKLKHTFLDLGLSPLSNEYLQRTDIDHGQIFFPLKVTVCEHCFLTQAAMYQRPEQIFRNYKYFSSYSKSWLAHCKAYVDMIVQKLELGATSKVMEIACNDGYLLQYFKDYNVQIRGVEPAENVAVEAHNKGIDVRCCFFNDESAHTIAAEEGTFDLVIGNNVLAHVPDINSFVAGLAVILKDTGTITMEFPHLLRLIQYSQFDTIYHEHFYYLSLMTVNRIFKSHGLKIYDVEQLSTHGGSLRIYAAHAENEEQRIEEAVHRVLEEERDFGLGDIKSYTSFSKKAQKIKLDTLRLLSELRQEGKHIAAFGAAAKGNTFLNYCGIKQDTIDFVVDSNPYKRGLYLPGSLIPIVGPEELCRSKPAYLLILPWNLSEEIMNVASFVREWGCKFIVCIPEVRILN